MGPHEKSCELFRYAPTTDGGSVSHEISGNYERNYERRIDLSTEEWTDKLARASLYRKTALVHIRLAIPGERVVTTLADGTEETYNTAGEDQVVITNPSGEQQIVSFEKAVQRYDLTDTPDLFLAKGMVRAIDSPFDHPISIRAPWGAPQHGDVGCKIVALYDPYEPDVVSADRYIIGKDEFSETYGDQPIALDSEVANQNHMAPVASARVLEMAGVQTPELRGSSRSHLGLGAASVRLANLFSVSPSVTAAQALRLDASISANPSGMLKAVDQ